MGNSTEFFLRCIWRHFSSRLEHGSQETLYHLFGGDPIRQLTAGSDGRIWFIGTGKNGVSRFDPSSGALETFSEATNTPSASSSNPPAIAGTSFNATAGIDFKGAVASFTPQTPITTPGVAYQATVNWGDGTPIQVVVGNPTTVTHTFADGLETRTISATATDEDGAYAAGNTVGVTVNNVAPTLTLSGAASVYDLAWSQGLTYGDVRLEEEVEFSKHNFEAADIERQQRLFHEYEAEGHRLLAGGLVLPAYDYALRCSHTFNVLEARGAISVTERTGYIQRVRRLAVACAKAYLAQREAKGFPLLRRAPAPAAS